MIRDTDIPQVARDVARRVRRGRRALVVKSMKCPGGDLRLESGLERDVGLMLDLDPRIIEITAQPFTLELQSNKLLPSRQHHVKRAGTKPRFYTPDFCASLTTVVLLLSMRNIQNSLKNLNRSGMLLFSDCASMVLASPLSWTRRCAQL